ncbi:MAG: hypothetical protein JNL25_07910 [Rhodospirillaceae bacterium]|nr:hypothetical protein [Rhodospirillaceae bacterium]
MFRPMVRTGATIALAAFIIWTIGDWSLVPEVRDANGLVKKYTTYQQLVNALNGNRDLCFSVAAGAFALWSHWQSKAASIARTYCDDFHQTYGESIRGAIDGIREVGVGIQVEFRKAAQSHTALATYICDDAEQRLTIHIIALHSFYREILSAHPTHYAATEAHAVAIKCEDEILEQLNNLTASLASGREPDIAAQLTRTIEAFTSICQQLTGKYDALRRNPPTT